MRDSCATVELELIHEVFARPGLPEGWYTDTPFPRYKDGWDCRGGDGVIVTLPHDAWTRLRVEIDLSEVGERATGFCGTDSRTGLALALGTDPHARHQATDAGNVITQSAIPAPRSEPMCLVFTWAAAGMTASVNGVELLATANLRRSARAGSFQMGFRGCVVRRVAVYGVPEAEISADIRALGDDYPLEVTVDFNDDLMACAWSHRTFDALFTELKAWGTRRVSWIDLGRAEDAYFDHAPLGIAEHGLETQREVGDIFTTAVETAHRHGIELIGILKPFDMAIHGLSWPPQSEIARQYARIHRIGGSTGWATRMAQEHQHLLTARKPSNTGPAIHDVWTRIDLVKDDDAPAAIAPADITLIISDDNETFRPYDGPLCVDEVIEDYSIYQLTPSGPRPTGETRRCRIFRFHGLELREPYVALQVAGGARSFANRLCDLVHVFGPAGEERRLTYGLSPRRLVWGAQFLSAPGEGNSSAVGPRGGFEYNRYPGTPSSYLASGGDGLNTPLALDRGQCSYLALARGKDASPLGLMSPCFPETRALWLGWIHAMLDAGADGIDIRPGHHHADFAWIEYGFEAPVREEMLRRTGVDIWATDDFDYDLWRRIRGEGWTQFIREASAVVRGRGKPLTLHVDGHYDAAPDRGGTMNIIYDWRTWFDEGLLDRVTGKALWPGASFSREVMALAHARGIPVSYAPYCNNFFEDRSSTNHLGDSPRGCEVPVDRLIAWGKAFGYDSFLFYECASALRARPDGTIGFRANAEPLRAVMRRHFVHQE